MSSEDSIEAKVLNYRHPHAIPEAAKAAAVDDAEPNDHTLDPLDELCPHGKNRHIFSCHECRREEAAAKPQDEPQQKTAGHYWQDDYSGGAICGNCSKARTRTNVNEDCPAYRILSNDEIKTIISRKPPAAAKPQDEPKRPDAVELALRKRIHQLEGHNQWFERCESGWCNPSEDCDPAKGIFLAPLKKAANHD